MDGIESPSTHVLQMLPTEQDTAAVPSYNPQIKAWHVLRSGVIPVIECKTWLSTCHSSRVSLDRPPMLCYATAAMTFGSFIKFSGVILTSQHRIAGRRLRCKVSKPCYMWPVIPRKWLTNIACISRHIASPTRSFSASASFALASRISGLRPR